MGKPDSAQTPNQAISEDNQNFNINIEKLYTSWMKSIDTIRSLVPLSSENLKIFDAIKKGNAKITAVPGAVKPEITVQESRCHAFYRWIGFPVSDSSKSNIYNPGFDVITDKTRQLSVDEKKTRVTNQIPEFEALSFKREDFVRKNLAIFSNNRSINAAVLCLSSGGTRELRKFSSVFNSGDSAAFDMSPENQTSEIDTIGLVAGREIPLSKYQDSSGKPPTAGLQSKRPHIIRPFMVDGRIDFMVNPQSKLINVPFTTFSSHSKLNSVKNIKRPLIEKIIRDRFATPKTEDLGTATNTVLQIVANFNDIKDDPLIQKVTNKNSVLVPTEQTILSNAINTIKSMMQKLSDAKNKIKEVQGDYYWPPIPSTSGPDAGFTLPGVFFPTVIDSQLVTAKDAEIFFSGADVTTDSVNLQGADATGEPDPGDFGLEAYTTTFGPDTTDALGDNATQNQESIVQKRKKALTEAGKALQTIEMIMGDFSGLGLADIVAVWNSLQIMKKENLLGFLDKDAQARAKLSVPALKNVSAGSYAGAMDELTSTVKDFYNLMDKIYQDIHNGVST